MLGLEDEMSNVVDIRPDRFLRELRDYGDVNKACDAAGLPFSELTSLCVANIQFDRAYVACYLEYLEEAMQAEVQRHLVVVRTLAYTALEARHG